MLPIHRLQLANFLVQQDIHNAQDDLWLNQVAVEARRRRRRNRVVWVRNWLQRRPLYGQYKKLMVELWDEDVAGFHNFMRMDPAMFQELIQCLGDRIRKQDTWFWKALEPGLKLAITLRHLVTGDNYHSLMYSFRVTSNTISLIAWEVCAAIIDEFAAEVLDCPTSPQEWQRGADQFADRCQMYHAINAIYGKHVPIKCPKRSGLLFYNYNGFYSIILLALVDIDNKFLRVDVGQNGSSSDAQIFNLCELKEAIKEGTIVIWEQNMYSHWHHDGKSGGQYGPLENWISPRSTLPSLCYPSLPVLTWSAISGPYTVHPGLKLDRVHT